MDEPVLQVVESSTDLTPVVERLDQLLEVLIQVELVSQCIFVAIWALSGVVVGCVLAWLLHDLWRA